jgi:hypothetical protein
MSSSTNSPTQDAETEHLQDRDTAYLLGLLNEYSEKLRFRTENLSRARLLTWLIAIATSAVVISTFCVCLLMSSPLSSDQRLGLAGILSAITAALGALMGRQMYRRAQFEQDAIVSSLIGLERLVSRGSQMEDHGNVDFT